MCIIKKKSNKIKCTCQYFHLNFQYIYIFFLCISECIIYYYHKISYISKFIYIVYVKVDYSLIEMKNDFIFIIIMTFIFFYTLLYIFISHNMGMQLLKSYLLLFDYNYMRVLSAFILQMKKIYYGWEIYMIGFLYRI